MGQLRLTPEDLLAGANTIFEVVIPTTILHPGGNDKLDEANHNQEMTVQLRPLAIGTFQLIMKAAKNDMGLIPLLMIKESLTEPVLTLDQIKQLHLGLIEFLVEYIRQISGLTQKKNS